MKKVTTIVLFIIFACVPISAAIDKFHIDIDQDTTYLPFYFTRIYNTNNGVDRVIQTKTCHVIQPEIDNQPGEIAFSYNPRFTEDMPGNIGYREYPSLKIFDEDPIWLIFNDWFYYYDSVNNAKYVASVGYRNDSAYAFMNPLDNDTGFTKIFITSGTDRTGNNKWCPYIHMIAMTDYDLDGHQELFAYINSARDISPRLLCCIELNPLRLEWSVPVASTVHKGYATFNYNKETPKIILTAYNTSQGAADTLFTDRFSYVITINNKGIIESSYITGQSYYLPIILDAPLPDKYYITHLLPFLSARDTLNIDTVPESYYISIIDELSLPSKTIELDCQPTDMWLATYKQIVKIYDTNLTLIAESDTLIDYHLADFQGKFKIKGETDSVNVFRNCILSNSFTKLAEMPVSASELMPITYESADITEFAFSYNNGYYVGKIQKRSFFDLLIIAYVNYNIYIISSLLTLLVGLIIVNFFRHRHKSMVNTIKKQKHSLEITQNKLIETHLKLLEAEKYKQAKDIAGGFAHKIRNALFPAQAHLKTVNSAELNDHASMDIINHAIVNVLELTDKIKAYTNIEHIDTTDKVDLNQCIYDEIHALKDEIMKLNITVTFKPENNFYILFNRNHTGIVLRNILRNSIEAVQQTQQKEIKIICREEPHSKIVCEIIDTGCGIKDTDFPHIFDVFFTTKPNAGTGLGLSMVKILLGNSGNYITFTSEVNKGTSATIYFNKWSA